MMVVKIQGKVEFRCSRGQGGHWVAVCDPLAHTFQSETWATLMDDIAQTLNATLKDLLESRELGRFLRDRGWQPIGGLWDTMRPKMAIRSWLGFSGGC